MGPETLAGSVAPVPWEEGEAGGLSGLVTTRTWHRTTTEKDWGPYQRGECEKKRQKIAKTPLKILILFGGQKPSGKHKWNEVRNPRLRSWAGGSSALLMGFRLLGEEKEKTRSDVVGEGRRGVVPYC